MSILSEEAEKQIIAQVTAATLESMERLSSISSLPEIMKKGELVDLLNCCNNSADAYIVGYLPFITVGSDKRWIKSEVLRVLKEHQEYLN